MVVKQGKVIKFSLLLSTTAWICFKFCAGVPLLDPYPFLNRGTIPFFHGIMGNFVQFWPILKKASINHWPEIIHIWFAESPGDLVSSLFKLA